jgi:hypothetical protein
MISPPRPRAGSRVLTLVALLVALAGCVDPQEPTDAAPPTSVVQPTPTSRDEVASHGTVPGEPVQFGPAGVGALRLGMTRAEVAATGLATTVRGSRHDGWRRGCFVLEYRTGRLGRTPGDTLSGAVSADQGVERLYATYAMVTPQGIRVGSPIEEVRTAYGRPGVEPGDQVQVRASDRAVYRIFLDEAVVASMQLELRRPECTI